MFLDCELTESFLAAPSMPRGSNLRGSAESSDRFSAKPLPSTVSGAAAGQVAAAEHMLHVHEISSEVREAARAAAERATAGGKHAVSPSAPIPVEELLLHVAIEPSAALEQYRRYHELVLERVHAAVVEGALAWPAAISLRDGVLTQRAAARDARLSSVRATKGGNAVLDAAVSHAHWMPGHQQAAVTGEFCEDANATHALTVSGRGATLALAVLAHDERRKVFSILSLHAYPGPCFEGVISFLWNGIRGFTVDAATVDVTLNSCLSLLWFFPLRAWGFQPRSLESVRLFNAFAQLRDVETCPQALISQWERGEYAFAWTRAGVS